MDRINGEVSLANFGPQWLSGSFSKETHFGEDDIQRHSNGYHKPKPNSSIVKKIPLRYTRSKSTPLLPSPEDGQQVDEESLDFEKNSPEESNKGNDVFTMLKERNLFDRNFPSLSKSNGTTLAPNGSTLVPNGSTLPSNVTNLPSNGNNKVPETNNAWKSSQNKPIPLNGTVQSGNNSPPSEHMVDEIQLASCVVPTVHPPKVLTRNRVELLTKKGPVLNPKKKFDISPLRKATSEPSLPIPSTFQENFAKLMNTKKATIEKEKQLKPGAEKPKSGTVVLNRNDFFKGLVRKDSTGAEDGTKQHRRVGSEDNSHIRRQSFPSIEESGVADTLASNLNSDDKNNVEVNTPASLESIPTPSVVNVAETLSQLSLHTNGNLAIRSSSPKLDVSVEDEERFLRDLGWLPEEEAHVPELTEEEIQESALQLKRWMADFASSHKKRITLDVLSIKKWQSDQFAPKIY